MNAPSISSPLGEVPPSIFSHMTAMATAHDAVNLGQGFPDFDGSADLKIRVIKAILDGRNQYPPMSGVPDLTQAISEKIERDHGHCYDPATEITVTPGATLAIYTAIACFIRPGDEVIVLEPSFDIYRPAITMAGAKVVSVNLDLKTFHPDLDAIEKAITKKTRAIIINTPHNPMGTIWHAKDMRRLESILTDSPIVVVSDEVYEHMVFDGQEHHSVARFPGLVNRAFVVASFGKTFHMTGWRMGYIAAPAQYTRVFRALFQNSMFGASTPMQYAFAQQLRDVASYANLSEMFQEKRDFFRQGLSGTRLAMLPCEGTYFQCADYSAISDLPDMEFCEWLCKEKGVAAIPVSNFYPEPNQKRLIRFCFGKRRETLEKALDRLQTL